MKDEMELQIDLWDMLYRVLKKWRGVILGGVIVALLAGAFKFATGMLAVLDPEALAEAEEKYEITLNDHVATGESLERRIDNLRESAITQQEYNDNSALMKIDPMEKYVGSFMLYVDSGYQIDPNLSYQNIDLTNRLVSAYASYLRSGELYNEVLSKTDVVDEIRFLTEILSSSVDVGSSTITVSCVGKSQEDVQAILTAVKEGIQAKYATVSATIGKHTYDLLMESLYTTIDLGLDSAQKENIQAISDYAIAIGETNRELDEWEKTPEPEREFGVAYTVKESIKFIILGGVIGVLVMVVAFAVGYILNGKIKADSDWRAFGVSVLGHISREQKKKRLWRIDRWIDRHIGGRRSEAAWGESCRLAAYNLNAVLKERGMSEGVLIGDIDRGLAFDIAEQMNGADAGVQFVYAGNILTDGEAVKRIGETSELILLAETYGTTYDSVKAERTLLSAWGKSILGVVTVE